MNTELTKQLESTFDITITKIVGLYPHYYLVKTLTKEECNPGYESFVFGFDPMKNHYVCLNRAYWENVASKEFESCDSFVYFYNSGDNYWDEDLLPAGEDVTGDLESVFNRAAQY